MKSDAKKFVGILNNNIFKVSENYYLLNVISYLNKKEIVQHYYLIYQDVFCYGIKYSFLSNISNFQRYVLRSFFDACILLCKLERAKPYRTFYIVNTYSN